MKQIIAALALMALLAFSSISFAAPFLVCDPHPQQADAGLFFKVSGLPPGIDGTHVNKEAVGQPSGFKLDLASTPNAGGPYTVKAKACITDPIWGERCSADSNPFTFSSPAVPASPAGAKLIP